MREIRIVNYLQAYKYIENGINPIRVESENNKIVFIFLEKDTKEIFKKWRNFEL